MTSAFEYELNQYMEMNKKCFPAVDLQPIKELIVKSDKSMSEIRSLKLKSPAVARVLSVCFGYLGIDRLYAGNYIMGLLKLFTGGFWIIGWIVDIKFIERAVQIRNEDKLRSFLTGRKIKTKVDSGTVIENLKGEEGRTAIRRLLQSIKNLGNSMS